MSSTLRISALLLAVLMLLGGCQTIAGRSAEPVSGVEFAMNTWVEQRWYGDEAQETYDDIMACLRDLEARLSLYREDSEIAALNASAGGSLYGFRRILSRCFPAPKSFPPNRADFLMLPLHR